MTSWSLGVLIGLPVILVGIVVTVILSTFFLKKMQDAPIYSMGYDSVDRLFIKIPAGLILAALLGVLIFGFYPYKAEYHQWREVSGPVTQINSRIVSAGENSVNQKFVAEINGKAYGCNDTRCATVHVGDTLTLSCKRTWQYAGTDGYDCNFIRVER